MIGALLVWMIVGYWMATFIRAEEKDMGVLEAAKEVLLLDWKILLASCIAWPALIYKFMTED